MVEKVFDKINDLCVFLDKTYPAELAWDEDLPRIGFILGDKKELLNNILLTLDVTEEVVEEAINKRCNLIITHHPLLFIPIFKIDYETIKGRILKKLITNNIAVYSMHTNFDVGIGGVADVLASTLGLKNIIGDNLKDSYLRVGEIEEMTFSDTLDFIKSKFRLEGLKYAGSIDKKIKTIGILGGSGGSEADVRAAINFGCDLYISSEFKLNVVQFAVANDLCIIEVNHGIEKLAINNLKYKLMKKVKGEVFVSEIEVDPFKYKV
jgi:dinuclear metal center YbgI/SA1388 family protein